MKKITTLLLAAIIAVLPSMGQVYDKKCEKAAKRDAVAAAKNLKKEGFKLSGTMAIENELEKYYLKTGDCGQFEKREKDVQIAKTIGTGENTAARTLESEIAGELVAVVAGASETTIDTFEGEQTSEKLLRAYKADISAIYKRHCTLYKMNRDGKMWVRVLYLIDRDRYEQLQLKARRDADAGKWDDLRQMAKDQLEK